eukprot:15326304-Ditylum_brightwellii.AAC.1
MVMLQEVSLFLLLCAAKPKVFLSQQGSIHNVETADGVSVYIVTMSGTTKYVLESYKLDRFNNESIISGNDSGPDLPTSRSVFKPGSSNKLINVPNDLHPH